MTIDIQAIATAGEALLTQEKITRRKFRGRETAQIRKDREALQPLESALLYLEAASCNKLKTYGTTKKQSVLSKRPTRRTDGPTVEIYSLTVYATGKNSEKYNDNEIDIRIDGDSFALYIPRPKDAQTPYTLMRATRNDSELFVKLLCPILEFAIINGTFPKDPIEPPADILVRPEIDAIIKKTQEKMRRAESEAQVRTETADLDYDTRNTQHEAAIAELWVKAEPYITGLKRLCALSDGRLKYEKGWSCAQTNPRDDSHNPPRVSLTLNIDNGWHITDDGQGHTSKAPTISMQDNRVTVSDLAKWDEGFRYARLSSSQNQTPYYAVDTTLGDPEAVDKVMRAVYVMARRANVIPGLA